MSEWTLQLLFLEFFRNLLHGMALGFANLPVFALVTLTLDSKLGKNNSYFLTSSVLSFCILLSLLGLFNIFADPILLFCKFQEQGLSPRIPSFFEPGMLAYTISALLWFMGIMVLVIARWLYLQRATVPSILPQKHLLQILLGVATVLFWATNITILWPYAGKPENLSTIYMLLLLVQHTAHDFFSAFVPGGIFVFLVLWFIALPPKFSPNSMVLSQRMCGVWLFIGLIPDGVLALGVLLQTILGTHAQMTFNLYMAPLLLFAMLFCFSPLLRTQKKSCFNYLPFSGMVIYCLWLNLKLFELISQHYF